MRTWHSHIWHIFTCHTHTHMLVMCYISTHKHLYFGCVSNCLCNLACHTCHDATINCGGTHPCNRFPPAAVSPPLDLGFSCFRSRFCFLFASLFCHMRHALKLPLRRHSPPMHSFYACVAQLQLQCA